MSLRPLEFTAIHTHLPVLALLNKSHLLQVAEGRADDGAVGLVVTIGLHSYLIMVSMAHTIAMLSTEVVSQRLDSLTGSHVQVASESS